MKGSSRKGMHGFTLPEVMVASFISVLVVTSLLATAIQLRAAMRSTQLTGEMHQNTRFAIDSLCRDIRMAGYGLEVPETELDDWVSWETGFTTNPKLVNGHNLGRDALILAGAFGPPVTFLASDAAVGDTSITVTNAAPFDMYKKGVIFIGKTTTARITGISGNQLTISIFTDRSGGLKYAYPAGTPVELVKTIRYEWRAAADYPDYPWLARIDDTVDYGGEYEWMKLSTAYIEDLQAAWAGDAVEISVTGVVAQPDRFYTHPQNEDHLRRETLTCRMRPRN